MKHFFTLMVMMLSVTAFSQTVIVTETFPSNEFNNTGSGGQSGSYNGNLAGWFFKSSTRSVIEVDDAAGGGHTNALRFAAGGSGSTNNPRVDTATSPNIILSGGSCEVTDLQFQFDWNVADGHDLNYEVTLQFSGNGGSTWSTVWTNNDLPVEDEWNTVTVPGGIPNSNSYWDGADFRFRFTARRNSGSEEREVWFDNIRVLATAIGGNVPNFSGIPVLVQGVALQPGAVYKYSSVVSIPQVLDALLKIEVDSNAHVTMLDNNIPNAHRFQPKVANDGVLGNGSETSDKGWVQFSITFIKHNSYVENNPATDADDTYLTQALSGLRYQHYDVDGNTNGSGGGAGYFRETGWISSPSNVLVNTPTDIYNGGVCGGGGYSWRLMKGELEEHASISSDLDVTFTATFGSVSVVRFRLGFEYLKGNGTSITADREYATEFGCLSYPQQSSLPVKLLSFAGIYRNQATTLNWETENEQNFDHYEIERSSTGSNFSTIGSKAGTPGNSNRQGYQYSDNLASAEGNVFYYRLKMIDLDGQFKYSNVIMIRKESKSINGVALNPNPVINSMATVRFTASSTDEVTLRVVDMSGKVVARQQNKVYAGNNSISINNLERLQGGVYLLQLANGEELTTIKFNIAR